MRPLLLSACLLTLSAILSVPRHVHGADTAQRESLWQLDSGTNPCRTLQSRCSDMRYLMYERIIDARERGDEQDAKRWLNVLYWDYWNDRDD